MPHSGRSLLALLLALTAPAPAVFAQVRGAVPEAASGVSASLGAASAPAALTVSVLTPAPAAAPVLAAPSVSLSASPVAVAAPTAVAASAATPAAAPALASVRSAASRAASVPAAPRVSGERAKTSADALFDAAGAFESLGDGPSVLARAAAASGPELGPSSPASQERAAEPVYDPGPRTASFPDRIRDQARYWKLLSRSFWWYMFTHIKDMWPAYVQRWEKAKAAGPVAVNRPRAFFTAMRVTGMSGRFYALGGSALEDDLVIAEFRAAFRRYFDGRGIGLREERALERFMARAKGFNAEKRAHTNMYKNIRDPLIKASTMRPDQLADYFDSLIPPEKEAGTREFQQSGRMDYVRDEFLRVLRETLDQEDPTDPHRVRAAIVLGSFASGSAGPGSDFDVEALVDGASNARLATFSQRLVANWTAAGFHQTHPVTVHDNASWPSWGLVNIVQTRHYLVVSPEPGLIARLSRQAFENPAVILERGYTWRGRFNRLAQRAIVAAGTFAADWGHAPSSGH